MKSLKYYLMAASVALLAAPVLQSCSDDDDENVDLLYPTAMVTVKNLPNGGIYLQEEPDVTLFPVNMQASPFNGKQVRALVNYKVSSDETPGFTKTVEINWIDSILTKPTVPSLGEEEDLKKYGNDPVEIYKDWYTVCEDGYLTLRFMTLWGNGNTRHSVNLITGCNPENPYEVHFAHNNFDDQVYIQKDGLVAFDLSALPDTEGKTVKLKLVWDAFGGSTYTEFDYCTPEEDR